MPWRNIPPDILGVILNIVGVVVAGLIGTSSRIAEDISKGDREKVWSKELCVDVSSFLVMVMVASALTEYFEFSTLAGSALAGVMCRSGTPLLDKIIKALIDNLKWFSKS